MRSSLIRLGSSQPVVLGVLCLAVFSTALDQTVVVTALPRVMMDLEIPVTDLDRASWIMTGYLISYTVAMPLAGRLSDVHGRVRMFQAALLVFAVGSAFVALAPNFNWIVPARVIQAMGGGATVPIGLAMAVAAVSMEKRGLAIGLVAASAEAGSVVGPIYGGAVVEWIGWRWIFWLDVPQSLILIALLAILPNRANPAARMGLRRGDCAWSGAHGLDLRPGPARHLHRGVPIPVRDAACGRSPGRRPGGRGA